MKGSLTNHCSADLSLLQPESMDVDDEATEDNAASGNAAQTGDNAAAGNNAANGSNATAGNIV